jgi:hypothetical protein
MSAVESMTALRHLDVCTPRVTDHGVRAISGLNGLEVLWLSHCGITDVSVDLLSQLKALGELAIGRTRITAAGKARLQEMMPRCRLVEEA